MNFNTPLLNPKHKISLFFTLVWMGYLLLSPIYIFAKGMPQPADYLIFALGFPALVIAMMNHRGNISKVFLFGLLFASLTIAINLIHFSFIPNDRLMKHSVYYIFNFCVFMFTLIVFKQSPIAVNRLTYWAIATIIIFQCLYAPLFGDIEIMRNLGTFNNPNQLAYWSLLNMGILIILKRDEKFSWFDLILFGMCLYLQTLSLSKAGLILSALMVGVLFFISNMPKQGRIVLLMGFIAFLIFQAFNPDALLNKFQQFDEFSDVVSRLENIGEEQDDSATGRGYDRLIKYPHFLIFGAGEGAFFRFGINAQEIHSGVATLLFSYGITGFLFFGLFIWSVFKGLPRHYYLILGVIFLFGIPHQNIRFTYFWIFLALAHTHHMYFDQKKMQEKETETEEN